MYGKEPFFNHQKDWVTVWVGDLDVSELQTYLEEPGGASDGEPFSLFAADLGAWYDHDFIYAQASDEPVSCRRLCELNGIDSLSLIDEIARRHPDDALALLVLWNARVADDAEHEFAEGQMVCLGSWEHEAPISDPDY